MKKSTFNLGMLYPWLPPKLLLVMKLTTMILLLALTTASATTYGQKITLSEKNATLKQLITKIRVQSGYGFLYTDDMLANTKPITVELKEASLEDALEAIFKNQPLEYAVEQKNIVIKIKSPTFLERLANRWASIDANGRVVDSENRPLPGASVKVKKTGKAMSTDKDGRFFLRGVEEGAVLIVSFIGYLPKEVSASANMGNVVLEQSLSKLDEIQVIAYGTTTRRLSTGNVTTIKADVIEKQPVNNPLLALQGRVPGLFIEQATGFAGTGVKVRIQGTNSLNSGNDPLYVIDGIPFTSQLLPGGNSILGTSGSYSAGNPLNFINPADIESIDVLKDADATAIYGSRAANGAILITTKKGKPGDIKIVANVKNGWSNVTRRLNLMNSQQYLEMRREAFKNDGLITPRSFEYDVNGLWDKSRYTDWQKELIGGTAKYNDIQTSVSGGNNMTTFLAGAGYHQEGNVFPGDYKDIKSSVHFNLNSSSSNQRFKIQIFASYLEDKNLLPIVDLTSVAMTLAPVAPALYNLDGSINFQPNSTGTSTFNNPLGYLSQKFKNNTDNLIGNAILSYRIVDGLEIKSSFGYTKMTSDIISIFTSLKPEAQLTIDRWPSIFSNSKQDSWSIEPQINYHGKIKVGKLEVLLGATFQKENRDASSIQATGFSSEQAMSDISSATTITPVSSTNAVYKYNAVFGRINYSWEDRYILNLTARRDGSSRFGSENRFHNFGALAGAWVFSNESLIKDYLTLLSFGKLRASYGTTGSDQTSDYNFLSLYSATGGGSAPYQGAIGYQPYNLTNPYLQWEETNKLQVGLDLGFCKDRILLTTNYSKNRSSNQLIYYQLPSITGFPGVASNFPAIIQNTGWEFTFSTVNVSGRNFRWNSSVNVTLPKNKLVKFPDLENSSYASTYILGQSVNTQKVLHFLGVDPATGIYQFADKNGQPTFNPQPSGSYNSDAIVNLNPDPRFYGGFQNAFTYKNFQLDVSFQFTKQLARNYLFGSYPTGTFNTYGAGNQPIWQLDRWRKPGDITSISRATSGSDLVSSWSSASSSDVVWSDASYIRLNSLSISWRIPEAWEKSIHLKKCILNIQGRNLFTLTNYLGLDPETKSSNSLPPLRVLTLGIDITL
ncbi:SusC/RagA family TonB-linked outer membrane protein [Pedobacter sp. HMWF019]|uniref:SusC/RagA family TonB-linked outer membrane protein n=1 Tax=Pedobacter sp. HMWF019 TaxID=2056856 RepID=UPI000D334B64|nr:SusC/RagA family TonB-linked outer membrane protein [Pedobacter sp. HMWF019]PTT02453.1 SusC/RagA family TonB-linked outer membrane protein [Pedobacter sp. HMWF019]